MIIDERVFDDREVPEQDLVVHRHEELNRITGALKPIVDGRNASNIYLFGPSGAGKTLTMRLALNRLQEFAAVDVAIVNCWDRYERHDITFDLCETLTGATDIHRQSTSRAVLLERLHEEPTRPRLAVLDEADQLPNTKILYDLHRIPQLSLILIANTESGLFSQMESRVKSRFQAGTRVHYEEYSHRDLTSILQKRADHGLPPGAVTRHQLSIIARHADGDARVAIRMLAEIAKTADSQGLSEITTDVLEASVPEARETVRIEALERISDQQRALYQIIEERGPIAPSELYDRYRERVDDAKTNRTMRNYLSKMEHYDLIEATGQGRSRRLCVK